MKVLCKLDFCANQALKLVIENLPTAPTNPVKGLIYFNTTTNHYYGYDGSKWIDLSSIGFGN